MLAFLLTGLMLTVWLAPDTPVGRLLNRVMVETPSRWLARIRRGHVLLVVFMFGLILGASLLMGKDGAAMVSMGLPDLMALAAAIDLSAMLDLAAVAVIAASAIRVRTIGMWIKARIMPRSRHARTRRTRRPARPANDDEHRGFAIAA